MLTGIRQLCADKAEADSTRESGNKAAETRTRTGREREKGEKEREKGEKEREWESGREVADRESEPETTY